MRLSCQLLTFTCQLVGLGRHDTDFRVLFWVTVQKRVVGTDDERTNLLITEKEEQPPETA